MAESLTRGQKMFNQRLLAEHCVTEEVARGIWNTIHEAADDDGMGADSFEASVALCNTQLKFCGLEIVAVSIKPPVGNNSGSNKSLQHYAVVNMFPDAMAKKSFTNAFHLHQYAFVRLVLEKLVEGPAARSTLINLRNDLEEAHKLALDPTEKALQKLLDEKWIQESSGSGSDSASRALGSYAAKLCLAPRAYMELGFLLVDEFGMHQDDLPQQLYHRL
jgi:hypothetical protein